MRAVAGFGQFSHVLPSPFVTGRPQFQLEPLRGIVFQTARPPKLPVCLDRRFRQVEWRPGAKRSPLALAALSASGFERSAAEPVHLRGAQMIDHALAQRSLRA